MAADFPPIVIGRTRLDWSRTVVLGVVNVTPDSFSDGGQCNETESAVARAQQLLAEGADILDIGGESTRPGAAPVTADMECQRVLPVIERLRTLTAQPISPISIDTMKAEVAEAALAAGASIVNDVSGGRVDPELLEVAARHQAAVILGHMRGRPATMQQAISFVDVVGEVAHELGDCASRAVAAGIPRERIVLDPGLGFGKTAEQSYALVRHIGELRKRLGRPVCVGPSRKSFLGAATGAPLAERLIETAAVCAAAIALGADMIRVHDVAQIRKAVGVADAVRYGSYKPM